MSQRVLADDEMHFGMPCRQGTTIDDDERAGTLAREVVRRGVALPSGSTFSIDIDNSFFRVTLAAATHVHGHVVPSASELAFPPVPARASDMPSGFLLPLYPLFYVFSLRDLSRRPVHVRPSATIAIGRHHIQPGDDVVLSRGGHLETWSFDAPRRVFDFEPESGCARFDSTGALRELSLYRSQVLAGLPCAGYDAGVSTPVRFHRDGGLSRIVLSEPHPIAGVTYPRGARLDLSRDGVVRRSRTRGT